MISFSSFGATLEEEAKSGNSQSAYKLAEFYENKDDYKNAMHWYKIAAELSQKEQQSTVIANNNNTKSNPVNNGKTASSASTITPSSGDSTLSKDDKIASTSTKNKSQKAISDRFITYQDYETDNEALEELNSTFGLKPYHSNYILPITYDSRSHNDGRKHIETTFQISFKKDVFTDAFGYNENIGFAYTQRNWWQITEESSPFRETNYLPEVYVQVPNQDRDSMLKGAQFGFLHESNGQGNEAGKSRSWNRLYLEGYFNYKDNYIVPRVWYRIPESKKKDDNRHIEKYLGYGDINVFVPYEKHLFKLLIRNNLRFSDNRGAYQLDWTYPLGDTGLFTYVQYFYGYGESLIDYNKKTNRIGVGIALSR